MSYLKDFFRNKILSTVDMFTLLALIVLGICVLFGMLMVNGVIADTVYNMVVNGG